MKTTGESKNNHFLSQTYLRQWETSPGKTVVYRLLVSHKDVPLWSERSIRGIGYQRYLYSREIPGIINDSIENWFSVEFESPARDAIQRAVRGDSLTADDWRKLVKFLALHDVRTPARLVEHLRMTGPQAQAALKETLQDLPTVLHAMKRGEIVRPELSPLDGQFPLKVTSESAAGGEFATLKVETAVGRASWLWGLQGLLQRTAEILHRHRWTILRPAPGMSWFTTDKPVVRLNFYGAEGYDFEGGWGRTGTDIFMPLGPEHLLFTVVGSRPPPRGTRLSEDMTRFIRRAMAEHAYRCAITPTSSPARC